MDKENECERWMERARERERWIRKLLHEENTLCLEL